MAKTVVLKVPSPDAAFIDVDGVQYPVVNGNVTVPRHYLSSFLDGGFIDVSEATEGLWDDIQGDITQGSGATALTYEAYRDTQHYLSFFKNNEADSLMMRFQMPHTWNLGTVRPHLHYVPMVAPASSPLVFGVKGEWVWADYNQAIPAAASWTAFAAVQNIVTADAFKSKIISIGEVAPSANAAPSSILLIRLYRDVAGTDTYTTNKSGGTGAANVGLLSFDCHYQKMRQGTSTEFA